MISKDQRLLSDSHERAAKRLNLEFGNRGWVVDERNYLSKMMGGLLLQTTRLAHGKYQHKVTCNH